MTIRVSTDDFDCNHELQQLARGGKAGYPGAMVSFVGLVRDFSENSQITAMTLEHYPGMTEAELSRIRDQAMARWPLTAATIIHRVGRLTAGEQIVFVGCASPHRHAAFEAAAFIMDFLKTDAPFWKAEETPAGSRWVDARETDSDARARWHKDKAKKP